MRRDKLGEISTDALVDLFAGLGVQQDHADLSGDHRRYNRLYRQMSAIVEELRSRPGDQRSALLRLLDHPNSQVLYMAAAKTLAVDESGQGSSRAIPGTETMKRSELSGLATHTLVDRFVELGLEQDQADLAGDHRLYNRLFQRMAVVVDELRRRAGDQRTALLPLLDHRNHQVAYMAAAKTLAVAPREASRTLEQLAASAWYPQAANAGMLLDSYRAGRFRPE